MAAVHGSAHNPGPVFTVYQDVIAELSKKIETAESNVPQSKSSMV